MRPLVVLGATGSIGRQTLEVAAHLGWPVVGLAAKRPSTELAALAKAHPDAAIAVAGGSREERDEFWAVLKGRSRGEGAEAVAALAATPGALIVNGIVGVAGLASTIAALETGNRLALANKESLVVAGALVNKTLEKGGGELIPVDSEHSALFQCLQGENRAEVSRLILTASGGPFRGWPVERLAEVSPAAALAHPTWEMGRRITIDSATLMNKGFEVIEAHALFGIPFDRIEVIVHPQSILHSLVGFVDGSLKAHLGVTDMRIPIQYALTFPERSPGLMPDFDLTGHNLTFEAADRASFPALDLAVAAGLAGGSAPATLNAADEIAVAAFLQGRLGFTGITEVVESTLAAAEMLPSETLDEVLEADSEARRLAASLLSGVC
jgi:1-deoxy-D-xylulose-5-phosphate reductoisomerase